MSLPELVSSPAISAAALAKETHALVSLPEVYMRLQEVMAAPESSMQDAAAVVALDPSLTSQVLKLANSAKYNLRAQIETLSRAASVLGMQELHDLVLASSVARAFDGFPNIVMDMTTYWYRSVQCAFLAERFGKAANSRITESLFIRGLLLDVGHLILYHHFPAASRSALAQSHDDYTAMLDAETTLIGCNALQLGAAMMAEWGMPDSFVATFEHLNNPGAAGAQANAVAILKIAAQLTHGLDTDRLLGDVVAGIGNESWELSGLKPANVDELVADTAEDLIEATYRLFAAS